MEESIKSFIDFYQKAEKLKTTTRHSWLSDGTTQESAAEHSWALCLLAMLLSDQLDSKIDLLKVMKMVTIHDLAESVTGDIPAQEISIRQQNKKENEKKAFKDLVTNLPKNKADEIIDLWKEFEGKETLEAKFANALDKIESVMQHTLPDISVWDQSDFDILPYYKDDLFNFDKFIRNLKDIADNKIMEKIINSKTESRIDSKHLEKYNINKKS